MTSNPFMEQLNKHYGVWQEYNRVYEEWAKAHGLSVNSLLVLSALHEGAEDCTQKNQPKMDDTQTDNQHDPERF